MTSGPASAPSLGLTGRSTPVGEEPPAAARTPSRPAPDRRPGPPRPTPPRLPPQARRNLLQQGGAGSRQPFFRRRTPVRSTRSCGQTTRGNPPCRQRDTSTGDGQLVVNASQLGLRPGAWGLRRVALGAAWTATRDAFSRSSRHRAPRGGVSPAQLFRRSLTHERLRASAATRRATSRIDPSG